MIQEEITDINEIDAVLSEAKICRMALLDNGRPHIVPMLFGYCLTYEKPEFYFRCDETNELIDIIKRNNKAAFEIDRLYKIVPSDENTGLVEAVYEFVAGTGTMEFVTGIDKITGFSRIHKKYNEKSGEFNISEHTLNSIAVLKLTTSEIVCKKQYAKDGSPAVGSPI